MKGKLKEPSIMVESPTLLRKVSLFLFLVAVFLGPFNPIASSDTFYHLKTGQFILSTGNIPHADIYLSSAIGNLWVTHEWLSEVIFYLIYHFAGLWGLILFISLLATFTYYLLLRIAERHGASRPLSIIAILLVSLAGSSFWIVRPQAITFLLLALLLYCLDAFEQTSKKIYLPAICAIIWLWANVSASVILGFLILGAFVVATLLKYAQGAFPQFPYFGAAAVIAGELSLINPNSWRTLVYSITVMPALKVFDVYEWLPITNFLWDKSIDLYVAEIVVFAIVLIAWLGLRKSSRKLSWLFLMLGVSIMPFIAVRHLIIWTMVILPPLTWSFSKMFERLLAANRKLIGGVAIGIAVTFIAFRLISLPASAVDKKTLPVEAADFLTENNAKGNIFNDYSDGDYLIWRLWPNVKVFIDGRSEVIAGTPLAEYEAVEANDSSTDYIINDEYKVEYFIFSGDGNDLQPVFPLIQRLVGEGWSVVFWNDTSVVMARNDAANANMIGQYGLKYVGPFTLPEKIPQADAAAAEHELKTLKARFPDSTSIQSYEQRFAASHALPV